MRLTAATYLAGLTHRVPAIQVVEMHLQSFLGKIWIEEDMPESLLTKYHSPNFDRRQAEFEETPLHSRNLLVAMNRNQFAGMLRMPGWLHSLLMNIRR